MVRLHNMDVVIHDTNRTSLAQMSQCRGDGLAASTDQVGYILVGHSYVYT